MRLFVQNVARSFVVLLIATSAWAAALAPAGASVPGEVLVKIQAGASQEEIAALEGVADADDGQRIATLSSGTLWRLHSRSKNVQALTSALQSNPNVVYVEPNYIIYLAATPNDTSYALLWGLKNTGQSVNGYTGLAGANIDAEAAWNVTTGSASIVIGVVDTGVDYTHPDLAANIWSNPGGKGNVACAAGTHGFNAITSTCDPMDNHYHGTHVSGTIGAVGNNSLGVVGVNWTTSIMGLKFLDSYGYGTTANAVAAIEFAVQAKIDGVNVRVLSNSWGGGGFSKALLDEINWANENDILFVAAAGNNSSNNDIYPNYPSNYATPNMIAVAATDSRDETAYFTNYGPTTVHLGAPGVNIRSLYPGNSYSYLSGTSMAAPHVAGVAALILANSPSLTTAQVKSAILDNTDPIPSLSGKTVTGGRLNAARALGVPPDPDFTISATPPSRTVVRGASTTYAVTITPSSGFAGSVDLSVSGLPSGASGSFSPNPATATSTLTVTTTGSTSVYTYPLTITGVSGALTHSASVSLVIVSTPPINACPSFAPRTSYYSYNTPLTSVAIGDFNRDGQSDLALANVNSNAIGVRLGNGNGTFQSPSNYSVGNAPGFVVASDFNGDGKADLAVANSGSHTVSILLGNGDGSFQSAAHYDAGTSPFSLAVGDFNNDGKSDLAVADNGSSGVSVLLGQGNGTFQTAVQYGAAAGPFAVAVGDVNGDGKADLAVADYHANKASVLLGNGDGTFAVAVHYDAASHPSSLAFGDFNRDGKLDLAVSNHGSNNVSVLAGVGDGSFAAAVHYPAGTGPNSVSVGDINGDGISDVAVANATSGTVSILMGSGTGAFQAPLNYTAGTEPQQVSIGDFNGDGKADLAVASLDSYLSIFLNNGTCSLGCNTIAAPVHYAVGGEPYGLASGDFNSDGKPDLAAAARTTNSVAITLGNGDGTFYAGVGVSVGTNPDSVAAGDFNRDGRVDLATANSGSDNASVLIGNGDGTFLAAVPYSVGTTPRSIAAADFNRDGKLDLAFANSGSSNVSVLLGNGDGTFQAPLNSTAGTNPYGATLGDFNRDGKTDLAVANFGSANVSILLGNGDGTFQAATNFNAGTNPRSIVVADFNHDGKVDLAAVNGGSGNISVLLGNGTGTFQAAIDYAVGTNPYNVAAGDFNDDGTLDLAVTNNGSNNVSILVGTGGGAFAGAVQSAGGSGPAAIVTADFNRDGKPDMATTSSGSGSVTILGNTCPIPDLTVTKTHVGTFTQGDTGKIYTITVTNSGSAPTAGLVSAKDVLPVGLAPTAMSGTGWSCTLSPLTCTRSDVLAAGASYPPMTLTVNVANSAPAGVTNTVTASGGGELNTANSTASDPATVLPITDLIVTLTHPGGFTQGATGKTYTIVARNAGGLATAGTVTVSDTLPSGMTATAISGTGWACTLGTLTCTRSDVLAGSTSYPAITLTVNVAANAPTFVTNTATVSGGSETNTANNTATDPTVVWKTQTCGSFGAPVTYDAGYSLYGIVIGDFNADGKADLVATNYYYDTVSILLGNGNGTFQSAVSYPAGDSPYSITMADMNNDGDADLVISNPDASKISVLLGNGDGSFAAPVSYSVGSGPRSVAIGDFNGDGNQDVAVTTYYSYSISILLGNGDGSLQTTATYTVGYESGAILVSDFDGNGTADLAVTTYNDGLRILLGNGNGTFQASVAYSVNYSSSSLTVGDFNQDGKRDLAVSSSYYGISILLGNGNGTFQGAVSYSTDYGSSSVVAEDLNGDGKTDLVVASSGSGTVSSLLGNGDGTFQSATSYYVGGGTQVAISDFNGDGMPDLAMASYYGSAQVMLGACATDLTIAKSHTGNFIGGQSAAMYTLTVSNSGAAGTRGTVTVTDVLPAGLTATAISGYGWNCTLASLTCTRNNGLLPGQSYDEINVYVTVNSNAPASVTNTANVSGGDDTNSANNSASDPTTIVHASDLTVTKTHSGTFAQGQIGRTYTITVKNIGDIPTSGTVTVVDQLPSGLSATALTGAGWNCILAQNTCSRTDAVASGSSYPPITLTVSVLGYAQSSVTNYAVVSGGGELVTNNDTAGDFTKILVTPTNLSATANGTSQVSLYWNYVSYATSYEILRSSNNGPFDIVGTSTWSDYYDTNLSPNTTYLYRVRAIDGSAVGPLSNVDLATTILFTGDPIVTGSTKSKTAHVIELRTAVNSVRAAAGLAPAVWTDSPLNVNSSIKAIHLTQLRTNLDPARSALGLSAVVYSDPPVAIGSRIKADHVRELRLGVK